MSNLRDLKDLIAICKEPDRKERLKSITKDAIADILGSINMDESQNDLMKQMLDEMKLLRQSNEKVVMALERIVKIEEKMEELKEENSKMHSMIMNQQRFLEGVDARERQCNAVFFGLPEAANGLGSTDAEKVKTVLDSIGSRDADKIVEMKRLGKEQARKKRPLLVRYESKAVKDAVMGKANLLKKNEGEHKQILKEVFIKRDVHPAWRKEHGRLWTVVRKEKEKPENAEAEITYNVQQGIVTRNGLVIDRFHPHF